jgi:hypothetical protein
MNELEIIIDVLKNLSASDDVIKSERERFQSIVELLETMRDTLRSNK